MHWVALRGAKGAVARRCGTDLYPTYTLGTYRLIINYKLIHAGGRRAIESWWARQGVVDGNAGGAGRKTGEEWQWCGWCVRDCESKLEAILHSIGSEEMKVGGGTEWAWAHASGTVMASEGFLFKGCDAAVVCCTSRVGFLRLADGVDGGGLQNEQVAPARDAGEPPPPLLPPLLPTTRAMPPRFTVMHAHAQTCQPETTGRHQD